jgi:hypothetical protein
MRRSPAKFLRSKIGRLPRKAIGNIGQVHAAINWRGTRLESEIEVLGLVELLDPVHILRV